MHYNVQFKNGAFIFLGCTCFWGLPYPLLVPSTTPERALLTLQWQYAYLRSAVPPSYPVQRQHTALSILTWQYVLLGFRLPAGTPAQQKLTVLLIDAMIIQCPHELYNGCACFLHPFPWCCIMAAHCQQWQHKGWPHIHRGRFLIRKVSSRLLIRTAPNRAIQAMSAEAFTVLRSENGEVRNCART